MTRPLECRGTLTALSEVHHGGDEQTGNVRLLRTVKLWDPDAGRVWRVPVISGNAIRGVCRRKLMADLLERVDYGVQSGKLHHALHTGGLLEGKADGSGALDLPYRRQLSQVLPPVGLLGTAVLNDMVPGQMVCNFARPFCKETAWYHRLLGMDDPRSAATARSFRDFTFTTRRDDLRDGETTAQMITTFEYFVAGTLFSHTFALRHPTPLLASTLGAMVRLWEDDPRIGGKAGTGFGELALDYEALADPEPYWEFLAANASQVRSLLDDLAERLEGNARRAGVAHEQVAF